MATEITMAREHKARKSKVRPQPSDGQKANGQAVPEEKQPKLNFFHRLAQLTSDDWDRNRIYVYRRWPRVARDGQPHYIGVHREALDEPFIKALYGSGHYLLKHNDPRHTIDQTALEIMDI